MRNAEDIEYIHHLSKLQALYQFQPKVKEGLQISQSQKLKKERLRLDHAKFRQTQQKNQLETNNKKMLCALLQISCRDTLLAQENKTQQSFYKIKRGINNSMIEQKSSRNLNGEEEKDLSQCKEQSYDDRNEAHSQSQIDITDFSSEKKTMYKTKTGSMLNRNQQSILIPQSRVKKQREAQIQNENFQLACKMLEVPSSYSKHLHQEDYHLHEQRVQKIAKFKPQQPITYIPPKIMRTLSGSSPHQNLISVSIDTSNIRNNSSNKQKISPLSMSHNTEQIQATLKIISLALKVKPRTDVDNDQFFLLIKFNNKLKLKTSFFKFQELFTIPFYFSLSNRSNSKAQLVSNQGTDSSTLTDMVNCILIQNKGNRSVRIGKFQIPLHHLSEGMKQSKSSLVCKDIEVGECLVQLSLQHKQFNPTEEPHFSSGSAFLQNTFLQSSKTKKNALPKLPSTALSRERDFKVEQNNNSNKMKRSITFTQNQIESQVFYDHQPLSISHTQQRDLVVPHNLKFKSDFESPYGQNKNLEVFSQQLQDNNNPIRPKKRQLSQLNSLQISLQYDNMLSDQYKFSPNSQQKTSSSEINILKQQK